MLHLRHQLDERFAGGLDAAFLQRRGQQRQRAGVAMHGLHELLDLLARGVTGSTGVPTGGVEHALDQLHRILAVELVQFAPVAVHMERRGQRFAAGEDEARVADLQQAFAQRQDGLQLSAGVLRERLGRLEIGRQENALHVVQHEQRGLLAQRALDFLDRGFEIAGR